MNNIAHTALQNFGCPALEQAIVRLIQDLTLDHLDTAALAGMRQLFAIR